MAELSTTAGSTGSTSTSGSGKAAETGGSHTSQAGGVGSGIVDKVKERATAQLTSQKDRAFEGIGNVAQAVRQSTQQLREQQHDTLAGYVEEAADQIDRFAQQLRNKDVTELLDDAQRLARRQPAVFVGSAFAVGLLGARFLKSSTRHHDDDDWHRERYSGGQPPAQYGSSTTRGAQPRGGERGREWSGSGAGVSPPNSATPVASGASYSSPSEPSLTPSPAGTATGGGPSSGITSGSPTGTTRARTGTKTDSPSTTGGSSATSGSGATGGTGSRSRRSGSDTERS